MEDDFTPVDPKIDYEEPKIKTAADRFREATTMPDFGVPEVQSNDEIFAQAPTPIPLDIARSLVDGAKIREDVGEQTAVAVENALTSIGALGDQATLAIGQLTNYFTGNSIGEDFMEPALKSLELRKEDMMYAEDSVGGVRNLIAQLGGGAVSMGELFLTSLATGGVGAYLQMGVEAFGEGAYNDMEKYKKEHDGSLKGYEPKTLDVAINTGNAFLQAWIEKNIGVGKKSFIDGWSMPLLKAVAKESISGFEQESLQSLLSDLAEVAKGNEKVATLLENAEGYLRDGLVGAILQGGLGAATYHYNHNAAVKDVAKARAIAHGREEPNAEDMTHGKNLINAKERGYASGLTKEFKAAFDASTGEGQLQAKIASALKKAAETKELDLDTANETEMAQRIEQIATQETLNAMDYAREQNRAISDMELNNIVYKDGAIWLEGLTPEVGDKAVSYARVLAERQSGLAEVNMKLDTINQEIDTLKKDLAEAKQQKQEARAEVLQARIDKQNALAEKSRVRAEKLKAQTTKLEKQIAKQQMEAPKAETVEMAKVKKKEPVAERKSLKEVRKTKKTPSVDDEGLLHQAKPVKEIPTQMQQSFDIADENARLDDIYPAYEGETIRIIDPAELKQAQYEVIQRTNPMQDEYHVGIRSVNDIKTFDETINDKDSFVWGDYSQEDAKRDLAKNEITIYSSKPIENGVFVSTSYRQAQEYAGGKGAKVYKKTVPLDYVAWISGDEGQFAITDVVGKKRTVYNSNGDRIAKSKEALTNFWRWFGDSKVVDEQGRPLVVYHGSPTLLVYNKEMLTTLNNLVKRMYEYKGIPEKYKEITISDTYGWNDIIRQFIEQNPDFKVSDSELKNLAVYKPFEEFDLSKSGLNTESDIGSGVFFTSSREAAQTFEYRVETDDLLGDKEYRPSTAGTAPFYLKIETPRVGTDLTDKNAAKNKAQGYDGIINTLTKSKRLGKRVPNEYIVFNSNQIKSVDNRGTFSSNTGNILKQGSISGKGDTNRGGYDDALKRIILGEKSDLSTIQHEFAHYWIQNNFKWARSGLASQDWLRRWRDVEEWLGIEPQDRLLSKSASEKFAKAYERYILEGKVAPELQWAFEGFQKAYQDIYDDLEKEYFDLEEELAPEVIDWFNRNKEQSPKRLLQADEKKLEKALTLAAGGSVIEEAPENTIVMTEQNKEGEPVVTMAVKQSEVPAGDNLLVQADKTTASKLQQSARKYLSDKVEVQQLATLDTQATLKNFKDWIARDRQGAWNAMMNPDTRPIYKTYLYKAFSEQAMNDVNLAMELANVNMAESVRELGQAIQALNIRNESGFDMIEIIRNLEKSKGELSEEELNNSIAESGVFDVELSEEEMNEIDSETECKL